jgi:hypothetical protein
VLSSRALDGSPPRRSRPARALAATAVASALLGAACSCPETQVIVGDFEGCTGTCGWVLSAPGAAQVVSTILPGEHGLQIAGGATASKSISPATIDTTYSLALVADCPDGIAATLAATIPGAADVTLAVALTIDDTLTSSGNAPDYTGVSYAPLVGDINLPTGVMSVIVHQVALQTSAGATCTIDLVRLTSTPACASSD